MAQTEVKVPAGPVALTVRLPHPEQKILCVDEVMPVRPGPFTLYYPKYIPGDHAPDGPILWCPRLRSISRRRFIPSFVASYTVQLPFNNYFGKGDIDSRLTAGWAVSGITSFVTGEVIDLTEYYDDNSLSGTFNAPADRPSYANNGSKLFQSGVSSKNPRNSAGLPYFNPNFFTIEPLGQIGDVIPRFFHGPGVNNTDLALLKNTQIAGTTQLQIRAEAFNVFNHTQFNGADGEIGDNFAGGFGYTTSANDPRIMQVALKLLF